ncbi:FecCD family ABC transporter permease [Pontibacter sp. JAM-7]|uniref:FecCD family ABC transporter permease n=1 Tax=Pontibacter sp. JAM-7 TaxID=3366581 RepID=UPI003AF91DF4
MRHKQAGIVALFIALLVALALLNLLQGPAEIGVIAGLQLMAMQLGWLSPETLPAWQLDIMQHVREPRVLVAMLSGTCFALSGAVMQGLFRNPLASPSILGVSSGASLGAVIALYLGLASVSVWALPLLAGLGAAGTLLLVYRIALLAGHTVMSTLLLAGIAVGAMNGAAAAFVLALSLEQWEVGRMIVYWTMGGLEARTWDHVLLILPVVLLLPLVFAQARRLDMLMLGEVHAASAGLDVARTRLLLLVLTAVMIALAVSVSGGIGFIGLVVPHVVRLLIGTNHRWLLPVSALGGAVFLLLADLISRQLFNDGSVPVGVITAAFGAPFFLFLLVRRRWSLG